jgi:hypothetical protein
LYFGYRGLWVSPALVAKKFAEKAQAKMILQRMGLGTEYYCTVQLYSTVQPMAVQYTTSATFWLRRSVTLSGLIHYVGAPSTRPSMNQATPLGYWFTTVLLSSGQQWTCSLLVYTNNIALHQPRRQRVAWGASACFPLVVLPWCQSGSPVTEVVG